MKSNRNRRVIILALVVLLVSACTATQATSAQPGATLSAGSGQTRTSGGTAVTQPTRLRATTAAPAATETPVPVTATAVVPAATATPPTQPTPTIGTVGKMVVPEKRQTLNISKDRPSTAVTLTFPDQSPAAYQFDAAAGQNLYITLAGSANLQVFSPSLVPLTPILVMPGMINIQLPEDGSYIVVLQGLGRITMNAYLVQPASNPASGALLPEKMQAVAIPILPYSVTLDTRLDPVAPAGYTFAAQAGQQMSLALAGDVVPVVIAPDGNTLVADPDIFSGNWNFDLVETGEYALVLAGNGVVAVRVQMTAPVKDSLPAVQSGSGARLAMPDKAASINLSTSFIDGQPQSFILNTPARHQLIVTVTGNAGVVQITGPDQKLVSAVHSQLVPTWSVLLDQAGDYTIVVAGSGPSQLTFSIPAAGTLLP